MEYSSESSFSPVEERFGFRTSGSFLCATPFDVPAMIVLHAAAVVVAAVIVLILLVPHFFDSSVLYFALETCVAVAVWLFCIGTVIRIAMRGERYAYTADEKCFTVKYKKEELSFEYAQVRSVTYVPIRYFGRHRGYEVRIETATFTKKYVYLFENLRMNYPTARTPFHIIEERAGLTECEAYAGRHGNENGNFSGSCKAAQQEIKGDVMPWKGTFCSPKRGYFQITAVVSAVLAVLIGGMIYCVATLAAGKSLARFATDAALVGVTIAALVWLWLTIAVIQAVYTGDQNRYEFDGSEFRAADRRGVRQSIYKCDVTALKFSTLRLYFRIYGYRVEVVTKYRSYYFTYLFPNRKRPTPERMTPFHLLEDD